MRKLASVQKILKLEPIKNADAIEKATILGWEVVVKKGEFKEGDLCVYCEIDSLFPEKPEFEFLRNSKFRIRTIRLRGQISQGICFPLSILGNSKVKDGLDVTDILEIKKYEPYQEKFNNFNKQNRKLVFPEFFPKWLISFLIKYKIVKKFFTTISNNKTFPSFIPKTDETRVQILQELLNKYKGQKFYITEKLDGSSITIYRMNGKYGVCSRNIDLAESSGNNFWKVFIKLGIKEKIDKVFPKGQDIALQGELIGSGIQGNKYNLNELDVYFFNAFDIKENRYFSLKDFKETFKQLYLKIVPILDEDCTLPNSIKELVELAKGNSIVGSKPLREGIVLRPVEEIEDKELDGLVKNRVSFKSINQEFLLKYE